MNELLHNRWSRPKDLFLDHCAIFASPWAGDQDQPEIIVSATQGNPAFSGKRDKLLVVEFLVKVRELTMLCADLIEVEADKSKIKPHVPCCGSDVKNRAIAQTGGLLLGCEDLPVPPLLIVGLKETGDRGDLTGSEGELIVGRGSQRATCDFKRL